MTDTRRLLYKIAAFKQGERVVDADQVEFDDSGLTNVDADDSQEVGEQLDRLWTAVNNLTPGTSPGTNPNQFNRPIRVFTETVDIDDAPTFSLYDDELALYANAADQRLEFRLPTDATVGSNFPVSMLILHQGGTQRITSGPIFDGPNNTIRIVAQGGEELRRGSETGTLLTFSEVHQNDLATITKEDAASPWVVRTVTLSSGALLLPDGIFNLSPTDTIRFSQATGQTFFFVGSTPGQTISAGDAFRVSAGDDDFAGFGVAENDVMVALVDTPSQLNNSSNEDWLIIRNAHNSTISLTELNFLNQITEQDTFTYSKLEDRSDVTDVRIFLATGILDHAPFITPSTDPNNPQGDGVSYLGGDEDINAEGDFVHTGNLPSNLVYIDIDGSFNIASNLDDIFFTEYDLDGNVVARHDFNDFRGVVLPGSTDTYYVFDTVGAVDNYSGFNYLTGKTLRVEFRATNRRFSTSSNINVLPSIADGSIPVGKLEPNAQALLESNHSISGDDQAKLDGLQITNNPTPWTAGDLFVKDNDLSGDQAHYFNVGQQNGILAGFEGNRSVTFVVPNFITVTQLQRTDDNTIKNPVTRVGVVTLNSGNSNSPTEFTGVAYTSTLPSSSFDINNPVGDSWEVDGTAANARLTGADDSFKVRTGNLGDDVTALIEAQHSANQPFNLPSNLQTINNDVEISQDVTQGWRKTTSLISPKLTREYAGLWTENRRSFTGNFFDDITDVQFTSFASNNIFFYTNPNDQYNNAFPGVQSYILNANVRVSNSGAGTNIENVFNKVGGFEYSLQRRLESGDDESMLRLGPSSSHPVISLDHDFGLHVNIGRNDGGQQTRTYPSSLEVLDAQWSTPVGQSTLSDGEIIIPQNLTGSLTVSVAIREFDNDNDEGEHIEEIVITNLDSDESFGVRTFSYTILGTPSTLDVTIDYDAVNNDLSSPRRVLFARATIDNAALHYNVRAFRIVTETWNTSTTYAEHQINSGDPHDQFGIFDPELWSTERLTTPEKITWQLVKWVDADTSPDPEVALRVIVNGELKGSASNDYKIRMYRPLSDFDTSIANYGDFIVGISKIQEYRYDADSIFDHTDLVFADAHFDTFFGSFTDQEVDVDTIKFNANLEVGEGDGYIIVGNVNGTRYKLEVDDTTPASPTITFTDLT